MSPRDITPAVYGLPGLPAHLDKPHIERLADEWGWDYQTTKTWLQVEGYRADKGFPGIHWEAIRRRPPS